METRFSTCVFCDGGCPVKAEIEGDGIKISPVNPALPAICAKVKLLDSYRFHPDRVTKPLKNTGKKGEPVWEEISWNQALDEIADRLKAVIAEHGPEAVAFAEMPLNIGMGGITRRLMNCIGTPNYTAPVQLCMGNTAQVHRAVYGWFAFADWDNADCIVYFGQDRDGERWPREYLQLRAALKRGAKLIEIDPRTTETAKLAQYHLPIRYGTDAALALAWINTIIEEDLYDHDFVESQCIGFEELRERAAQYDADTVAAVCNIDAETIRETARVYATSKHAIIPWGVVGDMQVNSTSLLQAQCILRAICGFVNNGETVFGPSMGALTNAQVADYGRLADEKRRIQLGVDAHPLLTFKTSELYAGANARIGLPYEPDIIAESCACDPSTLFAAMRGEGPYPVKAMFSVGNNTVMSYAGQQGIIDAFVNQDLVVTFENWMTPTAQLSDYVLPGDMWAERDFLSSPFDVAPALSACRAFCEPVGECKNWYFVVKGLADRLGFADEFPWEDEHALFDWRLQPLGENWESAVAKAPAPVLSKPIAMGQFVTPSGKVELASSVLSALGFDPLPSYQEPEDPGAADGNYPYVAFAGYRERHSYNTNLHQIPELRTKAPEPEFYINPTDAQAEGLESGQWCDVASAYGCVRLRAKADEAQPAGTIRVPHGWWKPETAQGIDADLACACLHNDGMLFPDEDWNMDAAQGVPNLRGGIHVRVDASTSEGSPQTEESA